MATFPFDVWGEVRPTAASGRIDKVEVVESPGGGYLILTVENGSEYDAWVETFEQVEADLRALDVEWPSAASGPDDTSGRRSDRTHRG